MPGRVVCENEEAFLFSLSEFHSLYIQTWSDCLHSRSLWTNVTDRMSLIAGQGEKIGKNFAGKCFSRIAARALCTPYHERNDVL